MRVVLITGGSDGIGAEIARQLAGKEGAGIALVLEVPDLGWYEELMRINLWGSAWCTQAALPYLKTSKGRAAAD